MNQPKNYKNWKWPNCCEEGHNYQLSNQWSKQEGCRAENFQRLCLGRKFERSENGNWNTPNVGGQSHSGSSTNSADADQPGLFERSQRRHFGKLKEYSYFIRKLQAWANLTCGFVNRLNNDPKKLVSYFSINFSVKNVTCMKY